MKKEYEYIPKTWNKEKADEAVKLYYEEGWTLSEIGKKLSSKGDTVSRFLKRNGYEIKRKGNTANRLLREDYFEVIDTREKAYFVGLLLADGVVVEDKGNKRSPMISLELIETDKAILDKLKKELRLSSALRYDKRQNRENGTFILSFRSTQMVEDLAQYGIVPRKSQLNNPVDASKIPQEFLRDFLRGFVDGDGSIYHSKGWHLSITGASPVFISSMRDLICDVAEVDGKDNAVTYYKNTAKFTFNSVVSKEVIKVLYGDSTIHITRKFSKAREALEDK